MTLVHSGKSPPQVLEFVSFTLSCMSMVITILALSTIPSETIAQDDYNDPFVFFFIKSMFEFSSE